LVGRHCHSVDVLASSGGPAQRPAVAPHELLQLKGHASYWTAVIGDTVVEDVAWSYPDTPPETAPIRGYFSFDATRPDVSAELPRFARA
jgi:Domain of unknown function (DUF427)